MARKKVELENIKEDLNIENVEKELSTYLEKKKASIILEIDDKIDDLVEIKINKRLKEEEKRLLGNLKMRIFRLNVLVFILMSITIYFGYCLLKIDYFDIIPKVIETSKTTNNDTSDNDKNDKSEKAETKYDKEYYIKKYGYLIENIWINDEDLSKLFEKSIDVNDLSNELKLKIAYKNLKEEDMTSNESMISFSKDKLLESAKMIFGEEIILNNELFTYNKTRLMFYNEVYIGIKEEENIKTSKYEIISVKEKDDLIIFELDIDINNSKSSVNISFKKDNEKFTFLNIKLVEERKNDYEKEN